ncbi:related to YOS1, subunit of the Yip1p-Yif1p Complex, required for Transport between the ER and the Golgi Complex [Rhynchosporium agropyri]|uniref:Related to YOS1, subunit of the Yip1p-Yif1p Complex, required for Transport between the ER and the Golgi Complex n=1 Tax=Rhynchosporium agropyri TaxID=914238 RepID=A0A1E1K8Y1_9HELO|nr:related to YOS1, subunit of the Yip1p-Yif1p Complex, required for Transport between the ER and the Golgi Complex [Rhynchosporium agropyri]
MMFFAFGNLIYISVLLVNAIAILSEDRFLARVGWSNSVAEPAFGTGSAGDASIKSLWGLKDEIMITSWEQVKEEEVLW